MFLYSSSAIFTVMYCCFLLAACLCVAWGRPEELSYYKDDMHDSYMHTHMKGIGGIPSSQKYNNEEATADYWINHAQSTLSKHLHRKMITAPAKNVIMFLGDGMSITTLAAARTYLGQSSNKPGEETELSFERFPYTGLSKTYCVDAQVADSACSATAYLCGIKANEGTIGVTAAVSLGDCKAMQNENNHVQSIGRWSQLEGKRTGVVTTTRITHASPSGVYANTAHRDWECDADVVKDGEDPSECADIAAQLVHGTTGRNLNVILGGGRGNFVPKEETDDEDKKGERMDGRNLINEWKNQKEGSLHQYVWNRTGLLNIPDDTEYLLGLFEKSHTEYNMDRDPDNKPSLAEMAEAAIRLLSQGENGYFLFVEGGRIDHAHHATKARKALNETTEFHKAIQAAVNLTNQEDTLIIVTSDHSHTMTLNGYPDRGNDVLGIAGRGSDELPYTTLSYANGPGYRTEEGGQRHDISQDDLSDKEYEYPALLPRSSETHGGEDVGIFAIGPWAHLFTGVMEQNTIPHIMAYAFCVGNGQTVCNSSGRRM